MLVPKKLLCNRVGEKLRRVGVNVGNLGKLNDEICRDDDVCRCKNDRMTISSKFRMANVGVDFLENREHDSNLGARRVETLNKAEYNVGVGGDVGKCQCVEPRVVRGPFLKRDVDEGVDSDVVDGQPI